MQTAKLYRYSIPIKTQLILRGNELNSREGLIVALKQDEKIGYGEISPLPFFSEETLDKAEQQTKTWLENWQKGEQKELENLLPSVAFGLSCALAEIKGELNEEADFQTVPLFNGDMVEFIEKLNKMPGEKIGKIKIAIDELEKEAETALQLFKQIPDLKLRLDANRKWTLEQAVTFGKKFAKSDRLFKQRFEFIEEPCQTVEQSRQFAEICDLPIAWDEAVRSPEFFVKKEPNLTAIVIKPTLIGSLEKCKKLIKSARLQGLKVVISSSIESSLGLTQLARFSNQYTPETIAGLDTLSLMDLENKKIDRIL